MADTVVLDGLKTDRYVARMVPRPCIPVPFWPGHLPPHQENVPSVPRFLISIWKAYWGWVQRDAKLTRRPLIAMRRLRWTVHSFAWRCQLGHDLDRASPRNDAITNELPVDITKK